MNACQGLARAAPLIATLRPPPATRLSQSTNASPDPYYDYGGSKGFELVLDLLDDACEGLLQTIQNARQ